MIGLNEIKFSLIKAIMDQKQISPCITLKEFLKAVPTLLIRPSADIKVFPQLTLKIITI